MRRTVSAGGSRSPEPDADVPGPKLDLTPLRGFRYACRPGCGLCCFAEPRVEPRERTGLEHAAPEVHLVERAAGTCLPSWPGGGACRLLRECRCSAWAARPAVCRRFPLAVHLGARLQVDLVLTCPGVDLLPLLDQTPPAERAPPEGFATELAAIDLARAPGLARRMEQAGRRRRRLRHDLERAGRWQDEMEVRAQARREDLLPGPEEYPVEAPPSEADGLELLPIFFDGTPEPTALAGALGGWGLLRQRPSGGAELRGVIPPPATPPETTADGARLLDGYLRYFLERDSLLAAVVAAMDPLDSTTVVEEVVLDLRAIGAQVLSRADVLRRSRSAAGAPLSLEEVARGIRASDQDFLDRPTWGDRL